MKTITVPSNLTTTELKVIINDKTYTFKAGATISVPDEVAEQIQNCLDSYIAQYREAFVPASTKEYAEDVAEVIATEIANDVGDEVLEEAVSYVDNKVTTVDLPEGVTGYALLYDDGRVEYHITATLSAVAVTTASGELFMSSSANPVSLCAFPSTYNYKPTSIELVTCGAVLLTGMVTPGIVSVVGSYTSAISTLGAVIYSTTSMASLGGTVNVIAYGKWKD